ncbi:MAG: hypothetical protein R3E31_27805 [Chloroflexota bacterium]
MATFNQQAVETKKAPAPRSISRQALLNVFVACAFPIHVWLIINVMREVPAWILRLSIWDLVGVISYSLMFALLETSVIFAGIVLLGFIVPGRFFRHKFVALSTMLVFVTSIWFVILQYNSWIIEFKRPFITLIWGLTYLIAVIIGYWFVNRRPKLEAGINNFVQRLGVLSFIYIFLDVVGLIIVIIRNI